MILQILHIRCRSFDKFQNTIRTGGLCDLHMNMQIKCSLLFSVHFTTSSARAPFDVTLFFCPVYPQTEGKEVGGRQLGTVPHSQRSDRQVIEEDTQRQNGKTRLKISSFWKKSEPFVKKKICITDKSDSISASVSGNHEYLRLWWARVRESRQHMRWTFEFSDRRSYFLFLVYSKAVRYNSVICTYISSVRYKSVIYN